jgi:hypothetical protein
VLLAPAAAVVELAERGLPARAAAHHEDPTGASPRARAAVLLQPAVEELELLGEVALTPQAESAPKSTSSV